MSFSSVQLLTRLKPTLRLTIQVHLPLLLPSRFTHQSPRRLSKHSLTILLPNNKTQLDQARGTFL